MTKKKVYIGIDVHARNSVLVSMDGRGNYSGSIQFPTTETELTNHVKTIDAGKKIVAIEESTLAYWVSSVLQPYVTQIVISDPRETPLISRNATKGDKIDAKQLCRLLRLGELKNVYHPQEDHRAIFKAGVQQYITFRKQQVRLKQQIKAKYSHWGIPFIDGKKVYAKEHRDYYLRQIAPKVIRNQLNRLYCSLDDTLSNQDASLDEAIRLSHRYPEIKEFLKVPGVGIIGALVFDAFIYTPHRFGRRSQIYRYAKLGVTDRTSDGKKLSYKRLDRAGNSELKAMSHYTFKGAMQCKEDNEVKRYYRASLARTNNQTKARLNTQRKILTVLICLWRRGVAYCPDLFCHSW